MRDFCNMFAFPRAKSDACRRRCMSGRGTSCGNVTRSTSSRSSRCRRCRQCIWRGAMGSLLLPPLLMSFRTSLVSREKDLQRRKDSWLQVEREKRIEEEVQEVQRRPLCSSLQCTFKPYVSERSRSIAKIRRAHSSIGSSRVRGSVCSFG